MGVACCGRVCVRCFSFFVVCVVFLVGVLSWFFFFSFGVCLTVLWVELVLYVCVCACGLCLCRVLACVVYNCMVPWDYK